MIDGVIIKELKFIIDERGRLAEMLRPDSELFSGFGQIYVTSAYPGVIKAWHMHKLQTDLFFILQGSVLVGLYDTREDSPTYGVAERHEFNVYDLDHLYCIKIPPQVHHGFQNIGDRECFIMNCPNQVYNYSSPDEYRVDPFNRNFPNVWEVLK